MTAAGINIKFYAPLLATDIHPSLLALYSGTEGLLLSIRMEMGKPIL
jgi:hypothetical protein